MSSSNMMISIPHCALFEHGVQNRQQLAHTSGQGDLLGFARRAQPVVEGMDYWIVADSNQRPQVQRFAHAGAPTPYGAPPASCATIAVQWRNADQGRKLLTSKRAQFRQFL